MPRGKKEQPRSGGGRFGSTGEAEVATEGVKAATAEASKAERDRELTGLRERLAAAEGRKCASCDGEMKDGKLRPASDGGTPSEPRGGSAEASTASDRQEPATEPVEDDADSDGVFDDL